MYHTGPAWLGGAGFACLLPQAMVPSSHLERLGEVGSPPMTLSSHGIASVCANLGASHVAMVFFFGHRFCWGVG